MVVNKCFICDTNLESFKKREIDQSLDSVLSKDLHVIFVLRNLFDLPREKVESYLAANIGNPSEWKFVSFCGHCGEAVENAKRIYQEMLDATKIFAAVKQEIVETVRRHWRRSKDSGTKEFSSRKTGGSMSSSDKLAAEIVEETRKFINEHDYSSLMDKDPFVDGDLHAKKLCSSKSKLPLGSSYHHKLAKTTSVREPAKANLSKWTVKNEPITSEDENDLSRLYMSPNDLEIDSDLQRSTAILVDYQSEPYKAPVGGGNKRVHSSESVETKRIFFKVKDLKNQRKQIHKSGPGPFMSKTSKIKLPRKNYRCELENCGMTYESEDKLTRHQLKHYVNKPFQCDWPTCDVKFTKAENLRRHKLLHSSEAFVYKCGFCNKSFTRKDSLQGHVKRFHFTSGLC